MHPWGGFQSGFDLDYQEGESLVMDWESKGKYSAHLFTERAQKIIRQHANSSGDEVILVLNIDKCPCHTIFPVGDVFVGFSKH